MKRGNVCGAKGTWARLPLKRMNEEKTKLVPFSKMKTSGKKFRAKLKNVKTWCKAVRNRIKLGEIWRIFLAKIRGHIQYYGISHNTDKVDEFIDRATRILYKWLNRRSQKRSFDWDKFNKFMNKRSLPKARVMHSFF